MGDVMVIQNEAPIFGINEEGRPSLSPGLLINPPFDNWYLLVKDAWKETYSRAPHWLQDEAGQPRTCFANKGLVGHAVEMVSKNQSHYGVLIDVDEEQLTVTIMPSANKQSATKFAALYLQEKIKDALRYLEGE